MTPRPPLVIVSGMPASGKSTLAAAVGDRLHGWRDAHAPLDLGVPVLEVDTTDGYAPSVDAIISWVEERITC